jgi:ribose transport system substrate-binding protein
MRKLAVLAGMAALAFAGCGSDNKDSSASNPSTSATTGAQKPASTANSGVAEAAAKVAKYSKPPTDIGVTEPLKKSPAGKKVVYLHCAAPICARIGNIVKEASAALGLQLQEINTGATPEAIAGAVQRAVEAKPAAVIDPALPPALFRQQLDQLKKQNIPVFGINVDDTPDFGLAGYLFSSEDRKISGALRADWIAAKSKGDAKVLYVTAPEFSSLVKTLAAFKSELSTVCEKCSVDVIEVKASDIGKGIPSRVVSYLQGHPDTKYVTFAFGDLLAGVPQAVKGAGLSGISLTTTAGGALNYAAVASGDEDADLTVHWEAASWQLMDAVARAITGQQFKIPPAPLQWIEKPTMTFDPRKEPPFGTDFKAEFKKLWDAPK